MLKGVLLIISGLALITGCNNTTRRIEQAGTDTLWRLPTNDLNLLAPASYKSLTQVYNDHMLENREVSFRDERLLTMRETNTVFDMPIYHTREEWEKRKKYLKEHILVCAGLWPMPEKNPLNIRYYHKIDHGSYLVETVTIETYPGYFLAGNIYRPEGKGPFPAILSPHGHFEYGRLNNDSINSEPGRCINLARQGYVVFLYDMAGYNDTRQVSHSFAADPVSALYGINLLGLQLRNSIRALDFLLSLPQVDTSRVGITGASGGGTQAYMLTAAVDDRFQVAAPVNMVSDNMQGGDLCENAPGLRVNTFNVEIAAMIAPKPLLLVSDTHDWTYDTRNTILPMVSSIYRLYHAEDKLKNRHFDYVHNYNRASTEAVYEWFGKWLLHENDLNKLRENPFVMDSDKNLLAFMNRRDSNTQKTFEQLPAAEYHDIPNTLNEDGLKALLKNIYAKQLLQYWPKDEVSLSRFSSVYGTAVRHLSGAVMPETADCKIIRRTRGSHFIATQLFISRKDNNDWIPCLLYQPLSAAKATVILTSDRGKGQWVKAGRSEPDSLIEKLLEQGSNVLTPDLFKQGEHILQDSTMTRRNEQARYFTTFNLTDRQEQLQDLLTLIRCIEESGDLSHNISLYSEGNTGLTGLLLSAIPDSLNNIVLDGDHFDPTTDQDMLTLEIPGILRIGGIKTLLALAVGQHLLLFNAHNSLCNPDIKQTAVLAGNSRRFSVTPKTINREEIIRFLTQE